MITEVEFLNALEIVKNYKLQLKANKQKHVNKVDLVLKSMNNQQITEMIKNNFVDVDFFRYSQIVKVIQKSYKEKFSKSLGRNNAIKLLYKFIDRGVIYVTGDFGFYEYRLKK